MDITGTTNVGYEDQVEVRVAIDCEPYASPSRAGYPSVRDRDNTSFVLGNVLEDRLGEVKVVLWRVTPPPCIVWQGIVWGTEISGCDHNGARQAPFGVIRTPNLIARPTT